MAIENFVQKISKELEMAEIKLDPMEAKILNVVNPFPFTKVLRELDGLGADLIDDPVEVLDVLGHLTLPSLDDVDLVVVRLGINRAGLNEVVVGAEDVRSATRMDGEFSQVPSLDVWVTRKQKRNARTRDRGWRAR